MRPYAGAIGPECILTDGNARPYSARFTNENLERETIIRMD